MIEKFIYNVGYVIGYPIGYIWGAIVAIKEFFDSMSNIY